MTDKNTVFQQKYTLNIKGQLVDLSSPKVMGILNLTPDSFFDGGRNNNLDVALKKTEEMLTEGADFIDIGAYSSRSGAEDISTEEELSRLLPILKVIVKKFPQAIISIDTFRSSVAEAAIQEGAHIINDIGGGELDKGLFNAVAHLQVPYILMHMKGTPQTMQKDVYYNDVFLEVFNYLANKAHDLKALGVKDVILDPGFGFAKNLEHNYDLLSKLDQFKLLELPILVGVSRKGMIQKVIGTSPQDSLNGTTVANTIALMKGASILRVHDVKAAVEAVKIVGMIK
jgi:dihydropteroate synthase